MDKYNEYKDSGIEWIGEIPQHWEIKKLKYLYDIGLGLTHTPQYTEEGIPFLSVKDISGDKIDFTNTQYISEKEFKTFPKGATPRKGDILFGRVCTLGCPKIVETDEPFGIFISLGKLSNKASNLIINKFMFYWMESELFMREVGLYPSGTTQQNLNSTWLNKFRIMLPPLNEQTQIANYLDTKCIQIDTLISKKEKLIEKLKKSRETLITETVTKGLDKNVSMKNSGIEWIGEIPEHWEVKKIKYLTNCLDGKRIPLNAEERYEVQGKIPYWGANGIVDYVDKGIFNETLILLGEDGAPFFDKTKSVAFLVEGKIWVNNHIHVLKPKNNIVPSFLTYCLNSVDYKNYIKGSTRDKLNQSDMNNIIVPLPAIEEQTQIANYLDNKCNKIDVLISKTQKQIEVLKKAKQSLIFEVVTGKRKVI